ncbi:MAG: hypothetical protein LWX70_02195 [Sphingobacteriia bacterium]|nr:hypothetical protein [Sphingobacteriia bacterium]
MNRVLRYLFLFLVVVTTSCSDEEGQYANLTGSVTFWTKNIGTSNPVVTINGVDATISQNYSSTPSCGASGCATFALAPGTYQYTAFGNQSWSGYITISSEGDCVTQELINNTSSYGNATFWTQTDLGCGGIIVYINGTNGTISSYYSSKPSCGSYGCANFSLPVGTYPFTASCNTYNWEGEIEITSGDCSTMRLYVSDKSSDNQSETPTSKDECSNSK